MTVLATAGDVEASLGRSLTFDETPRAEALLLLASTHVERVTRTRLAPGSYTVGRRVKSGKVRLPGRVASVTAVREIDHSDGTATTLTAVTDYTTRGRVVYGLGTRQYVEVDFTITASVPSDVVGVVAGVVASTISGPPVGVSAQQAGTYQVSYVNSSGKVWLSASDKAILSRYGAGQPRSAIDLTTGGL